MYDKLQQCFVFCSKFVTNSRRSCRLCVMPVKEVMGGVLLRVFDCLVEMFSKTMVGGMVCAMPSSIARESSIVGQDVFLGC